ncbi:MAG: ATP-binding cassette domain-containing protein, partial [Pseudomonadota bacterium]
QHRAKLSGQLDLRGVSFGYSPFDAPLIDDFNLSLAPGARIALVGGSGSGKSTIGRMICGLLEPDSGEVLLDGVPLTRVPRELFAASISYVDQEIFMFEGSIRDNLTLWNNQVTSEVLTRALRDAAILDVVMARPGGLDSKVDEAGANFSGGQRQRLEIARALVNSPTLIVLDEATAALDPVTEKQIDDNLRRRGCSAIIIAHRLSTIRDADEIIVLDQGTIVERGDHETLLAARGVYAGLIEAEG